MLKKLLENRISRYGTEERNENINRSTKPYVITMTKRGRIINVHCRDKPRCEQFCKDILIKFEQF